jgi:hypothetical protein
MTVTPNWLPESLNLSLWTEQTYDILYRIFEEDFIQSRPIYNGLSVWYFPEKEDGKELIFWHLTSRREKYAGGERVPDLRRSERLPWVKPTINNSNEPEALAWDYEEGDGSIKTYVWLKDLSYVVIMKKYKDESRRLITSYYLDYPHEERKMMKKYRGRL